jgi:hypothetical protein
MAPGGVTSRNVKYHIVIEREEVDDSVNKLNNGKASGEDGIAK